MIRTLADLNQFKEEQEKLLDLNETGLRAKIVVGMGTCGIAAGAQEAFDALNEELKKLNIEDVTVTHTGCIGYCAQEPLVEVIIPGEKKVLYGHIDADKARQIVAHHIAQGVIIKPWAVNRGEI